MTPASHRRKSHPMSPTRPASSSPCIGGSVYAFLRNRVDPPSDARDLSLAVLPPVAPPHPLDDPPVRLEEPLARHIALARAPGAVERRAVAFDSEDVPLRVVGVHDRKVKSVIR